MYHGLTGQIQSILGRHDGIVYCMSWAKDDLALVTASADYTSKVWHFPLTKPSGAVAEVTAQPPTDLTQPRVPDGLLHATSCCVLQHTCYVYAAEFHPMLQPLPIVATAGYDGTLRLFNGMTGQVLFSLKVSRVS